MDQKTDETSATVVQVLACVLKQLCERNDRLPLNQPVVSKFHALRPPGISIKDYLARISKYSACSGECFVLALVYIDRIIQSNPTFVVNSLNIHRLLITSVMLAAKYFDDQYFNNTYYAKVGGVPSNEMNSLEVEFLFMANFTLFVSTETYTQYYMELCNYSTHGQCGCASHPALPPLVIPPLTRTRQLTMEPATPPPQSAPYPTAHSLPAFSLLVSSQEKTQTQHKTSSAFAVAAQRRQHTSSRADWRGGKT